MTGGQTVDQEFPAREMTGTARGMHPNQKFTSHKESIERTTNRLMWIVPIHTLAGVLLGMLLLHPVTMVIYCQEFHPEVAQSHVFLWLVWRMAQTFSPEMWPMTGMFALIGAVLGMGSGVYARAITKKLLLVNYLDRRIGMAVPSLIASGENTTVEFKSSLRWDRVQNRCNKDLELVIVKSIAGFLNHAGGDLLIGVADDGSIVGLNEDYATLRKKDRDGFELLLTRLIKHKLGGDVCTSLHVVFHSINGHDVCRVMIEPSDRPVYVQHDGKSRYYVRMGNSTAELDAKEAVDHLARRKAQQ